MTLIRYEVDSSGLNKLPQTVSPGLDRVTDSANRGSSAVSRFGTIIRGALAGFGLMALTKMADEWAGVEGRVGIVTNGIEEQKKALAGLYKTAQDTGQAYEATASLFTAVQRNGKELGLSLDQSLQLTETIGTALTIGGGRKSSQQAALVQLSQALGSGTLRGEELNSVMDQAPRLAQAIAQAFNVPVGKLKDLGKAGKLSSKELANGLLKQSQKLRDEFDRMPITFSRAFTRLSNSLGQQVDKLNKNTKAAEIFYKVTSLVVDNLGAIIKWVAYLGAAAGLTKLLYAARAAGGAVGVLAATVARLGGAYGVSLLIGTFIRMLLIVKAVELVFEDLTAWFRGGNSLLGRVIGPSKDWKFVIDDIKKSLQWMSDKFDSMGIDIGGIAQSWGTLAVVIFGIVRLIGSIPALLIAGFLSWISVFRTNWQQVGEDTIYNIDRWSKYLQDQFKAAWDYVVNTARDAWNKVGQIISDSIQQVGEDTIYNIDRWSKYLQDQFKAAWDYVVNTARDAWNKVGQIISDSIPDFVKNGISVGSNLVTGPANLGANAGSWFKSLPVPDMYANAARNSTQTANVNVYTQTNTPAAVADAARRGTEQGLGASLVPMVETRP